MNWLRGTGIQTPKRSVATPLFRDRGSRASREIGSSMWTSAQQDTPKQMYETPMLEAHGTLTNIVGSIPCIDISVPPDGDCD